MTDLRARIARLEVGRALGQSGAMSDDFDSCISAALGWFDAAEPAVLAIVTQTWGSAPRPVGSLLAIGPGAAMVGSVSGGCVEAAVVAEAEGLESGARTLEFGVSDAEAFAVGLACGGQISVLLLALDGALAQALRAVQRARAAGAPVGLWLDPQSGPQSRVARCVGPETAPEMFRADASGMQDGGFLLVLNPPLRLIVVGAVHIAQALVPMAQIAGYQVQVIDPRSAFATEARFAGCALSDAWPDVALARARIDARTAIVTLTHDPKIDDPALVAALASGAFYVGALGSTRTRAKRAARLGLSAADQARLDAPVGLDIGARTPAEIAVAILAAMTQALRVQTIPAPDP